MGVWSTSLYGSDAAGDIRDSLRDVLRAPLDADGIVAILTTMFPTLAKPDDEEYSDMWLALADQLHRYGVAAPGVFHTADAIIGSGSDIQTKRALGMSEADLATRAKVLTGLRAKWSRPNSKPHARKVQSTPQPFLFEIGDCVSYPVKDTGRTLRPDLAKPTVDPDWSHAAYGAMGVLTRGHYLGVFAWYGVARLNLFATSMPDLAACAAGMIETETTVLGQRMGQKPSLCVFGSRLTAAHGRKMQMEAVGRLTANETLIRAEHGMFFEPSFVPGVCLANELSGVGTRAASSIPLSRYLRT
jgi:hypothetical protein